MVGLYSPFNTYVSVEKSLEGSFKIWIKYLTLGIKCCDIFGVPFCLTTIKFSKKKSIYEENFEYVHYNPEIIFQKDFSSIIISFIDSKLLSQASGKLISKKSVL